MRDFMSFVAEYQAKHGTKKSEAIMAVRKAYPAVYEAWLRSINRKPGDEPASIFTTPAADPNLKTVPGGVKEYLTMVKCAQAVHYCTLEAAHVMAAQVCPTGHAEWVKRIHATSV